MLNFFKKKQIDPKEQMKAVLGEYELPSFPVIVMSALEKVRDDFPDTTAARLAEQRLSRMIDEGR